jgi:adenosylcobinamide-phosphate synthase
MSAIGALALDFLIGEPPPSIHPPIWLGRWSAAGRAHRQSARHARVASFIEGACLVAAGVAAAAATARIASLATDASPVVLRGAFRSIALKPAMSLRPLIAAAHEVQHHLENHDVVAARRSLGWHLVSRDTRSLRPSEIAGAAIESVAENLSDSVVAPLVAYRAGGLSAAYAYRMINTADAMLGYRTPELEWFGKASARLDDLANLAPARLTAALIILFAFVGAGSAHDAAVVALRDARRTTSPNAGWPMAAMAGALGVRLTKRGVYSLNDDAREPAASDIARACRIAVAASIAAALLIDLS